MPREQLSVEETEVIDGNQEEQNQVVDPIREEFEHVKATTAQMDQKLNRLLSNFEPKETVRQQGLTPEQKKQLAQNPEAMFEYVEAQTAKATHEAKMEAAKSSWDSRAYSDFPALKTDKKFQNEVVAKMKDWVENGIMDANTPKLLHEATTFVARGYKLEAPRDTNGNQRPTSQAPSNLTRTQRMGSKISDNDQRVLMAKNMGITGERLAKFKQFVAEGEGN